MNLTPRLVASSFAVVAAAAVLPLGLLAAPQAGAHGYASGPYSRSAACASGLNQSCGSVTYEPQSLEAPKGFPAAGPADGKLASAGGLFGGVLDEQSPTRWYKNPVAAGPLTISWTYTAAHRTAQWRYFMTKQGWDQNAPLRRSELDLIGTVAHDGSAASNHLSHLVQIPADRTGYHVIYAVWDVADTANAFYNAIDVNVGAATSPMATPTATPTPPPTSMPSPTPAPSPTASPTAQPATIGAPTGVHSMGTTDVQVALMWFAPASGEAASYQVFRDGRRVGSTADTMLYDTGVAASTTYTYTVLAVDAQGRTSAPSAPFTVRTKAAVTPTTPAAPPTWDRFGSYARGDRVAWEGVTYVAVQSYRGYGDPGWIRAPSLWRVA